MSTKKNDSKATATEKKVEKFVFSLPNKGVDKVDYHPVYGDIRTEKGVTTTEVKGHNVRVRVDGAWESAFQFVSKYVAAHNQSITDDMRKALRDVSGVYANKAFANVAAFTLMEALGLEVSAERRASFDKARAEVDKLVREAENKVIMREAKAVKGGKSRFCEDARDKAGKQFDKLEKSFKKRSQAIQSKALAKVK